MVKTPGRERRTPQGVEDAPLPIQPGLMSANNGQREAAA